MSRPSRQPLHILRESSAGATYAAQILPCTRQAGTQQGIGGRGRVGEEIVTVGRKCKEVWWRGEEKTGGKPVARRGVALFHHSPQQEQWLQRTRRRGHGMVGPCVSTRVQVLLQLLRRCTERIRAEVEGGRLSIHTNTVRAQCSPLNNY